MRGTNRFFAVTRSERRSLTATRVKDRAALADTSAVWATRVKGLKDPAYVDPDAIEWLLLRVTGRQIGPAGGDKLTRAVLVQRVNTVGGKPPAGERTAGTLNTRKLVRYEADYYFYE
jgi:uncharacterized protein DUF3455